MRLTQALLYGMFCVVGLSLTLETANAQPAVQRSEEMEFDARVIQGQRAEGAVYLFQRASRPLPSLLNYRKDYLSSIVTPVFSRETPLGRAAIKRSNASGLKVGAPSAQEIEQKAKSAQPNPNQKVKEQGKKKTKSRKRRRGKKSKKRSTWRRRNR